MSYTFVKEIQLPTPSQWWPWGILQIKKKKPTLCFILCSQRMCFHQEHIEGKIAKSQWQISCSKKCSSVRSLWIQTDNIIKVWLTVFSLVSHDFTHYCLESSASHFSNKKVFISYDGYVCNEIPFTCCYV